MSDGGSRAEPEVNPGRRLVFTIATTLFTLGFLFHVYQALYWCNKFWSRRGEFGFVGRHKTLVWWFALSFLLWAATRVMSVWMTAFQVYEKEKSMTAQILTKSNSVITIVAFTAAAVFFSLRFWIIFYDCSLAAASSDEQWVSLITAPVIYKPKILCDVEEITYEDLNGGSDENNRESKLVKRLSTRYGSANPRNTQKRITFRGRDSSKLTQFSVHSSLQGKSAEMIGGDEYNWFFVKKSTYGNRRWLEYRLAWILPIVIMIVSIPSVLDSPQWFAVSRLLWFLVFVVSVLVPLLIKINFPEFTDSIKVLKEFELTLSVGLLSLVLFIIAAGIELGIRSSFKKRDNVNQYTWNRQMTVKFWFALLSNSVLIMVATIIVLIQTKYICLSFVHNEESSTNEAVDLSFFSSIMIPSCFHGCCDDTKRRKKNDSIGDGDNDVDDLERKPLKQKKQPKVSAVLADETGFHQFMNHLFNEFSYESLLCVVELQQFKTKYRAKLLTQTTSLLSESATGSLSLVSEEEDDEEFQDNQPIIGESESSRFRSVDKFLSSMSNLGSKIGLVRADTSSVSTIRDPASGVEFPESVTKLKSSIVWHKTLSKEQIFCVLCKKYILNDAEMSVNISYGIRSKLVRIYEVLTKGSLPKNESVPSLAKFDQFKADLQVNHAVFDCAVKELMRLMRDSLSRFCVTEAFQTLKLKLDEKEKLAALAALEMPIEGE